MCPASRVLSSLLFETADLVSQMDSTLKEKLALPKKKATVRNNNNVQVTADAEAFEVS